MNLIAYQRVSTQEQGDSRNGIDAQRTAIERWAEREGHTVLSWHVEVASGKHDLDRRPILRESLDLARKHAGLVIVSKLDRLSRSVQFISTLMNSRYRFATVEDGLDCDEMMLHMKAVFSERERKMIGERTKAALAALKSRGVGLGMASPNYSQESRSKALLAAHAGSVSSADEFCRSVIPMIRRLHNGQTLAQLADDLNRFGIKTSRNGVWHQSSVSIILKRARDLGL